MNTFAQSSGSGGLPLALVCGLAFVAILAVALVVLFVPAGTARRRRKDGRLAELRRYRVVGADADDVLVLTSRPSREFGTSALKLLGRAIDNRGRRRTMISTLERSGLRMRPEEWAAIQLSATVVLAVLGVLAAGTVFGVLAGALGWLGCRLFTGLRTSRRRAAFEQNLPDALELVAGALRAGFALNQSLSAVAREAVEPIAGEFARVLQEVRLGAELEDALDDLAERMDSYDMQLVVMSIRTAREIGGNLAEVLLTTVETMRERVTLRGQVESLSAEGRLSAKVLVGLPIVLFFYLLFFRKGYLTPMFDTVAGNLALGAGAALLIVGSLWLRKLTKIEV